MNHQRLILSLFVLAAVITGTAGYSSIQAQRSVDVTVANNEDAYLAVETHNPEIPNGTDASALTITNRFDREIDLSVQEVTTTGSISYDSLSDSDELGTGDSTNVDVTCDGTQDGRISTVLFAEGDNREISVRTMQEVYIECTAQSS
ncbi:MULTISPECIES: hypothetical protein [Haloarcula]|jgi:hypothetical protein|uniref:DUF1102 domain-containing protein n=2 Tax=Haloarcula marismortui TaxID=2238 RepID=M0JLN1_9EURY|nr:MULTISPECIES: hypothetical protein [Haloarcula]EMA09921.1 hypothetical protein C436_18641 [Haloarcula sinaiiensis ATCC 33800]EMA14949.1 hypothetical protein C435_14912 [Haloarcula californiae ATCC 33799]NHN63662.1 hypothetical protein [Haloarcula sp. JP-Z28]QUJ74709.1 hypothetical protein KDQ40_21115 [Haloarcula sinaiiensis ATCC 33800]